MGISRLRRGGAALITVIMLGAYLVGCAPPSGFYRAPATLPPQPGDVIESVRTNFGLNPWVTSTAIKYRSTTATGEPNFVTGTLVVPSTAWTGPGPRPIVGFAPGTQGMGDGCAVSTSMANGLYYEAGHVQALLDQGWAVAVTDYEGIGTPGDHTYVIKDAEAHAILDLVRAAQRLPGSGIAPDAPVGIWGYSQGGHSAAAVAEAESTYAPELDIVGVAAGGIPADFNVWAEHLDTEGNFWFIFLPFAAIGLDATYPELDLDSYLNRAGRDLIATARNSCLVDGLLLGTGRHLADLTTTNPLNTPQWQARIAQQKIGNIGPQVPVLAYHGLTDDVIPYSQAAELRDTWCARGTNLQWIDYPADHATAEFTPVPDVLDWLTDRFTDQPLTPTCNP
jgi:hypothetical protein